MKTIGREWGNYVNNNGYYKWKVPKYVSHAVLDWIVR